MKIKIFATSLIIVLSISTNAAPVATGGASARVISPTVTPSETEPAQTDPKLSTIPSPVTTSPNAFLPPVPANPTNRLSSTNQFAMTNGIQESNDLTATGESNGANSNFVLRDQAVTASDRVLLGALEQGLTAQLGITSPRTTPVHFFINNGAVTIVGTVPTADESQRILARVQQTPGVLSVFNDLHVGTPSTVVQPRTSSLGLQGTVSDHAFSSADRSLLTTVQQEAAQQLGITSASATQMPVHFSIQNGVVGVIGQLSSAQEKAALLADIQRTPGVVRVVDDISLIAGVDTTAPPAANPSTGVLQPTSRDGQTNNLMLNTTNSSGF